MYASSGKKRTDRKTCVVAAEGNLWQSTRPRLLGAGFVCQRIETSTGDGVPDVWVGRGDYYAWLENKATKQWPVRDTSKVFGSHGLRPEQEVWLLNAHNARLRAFVWAGVGTGHGRQTFLVPCSEAERFNDMTKPELEMYRCSYQQLLVVLQNTGTLAYPLPTP